MPERTLRLAVLAGAACWAATEWLPGRVNLVVVLVTLATTTGWFVLREGAPRGTRLGWPFVAAALALGGLLVWRDSEALAVLNTGALLLLALLALPRPVATPWTRLLPSDLAARAALAGASLGAGSAVLLVRAGWSRGEATRWRAPLRAGVGVAAVLPVLVLFGNLLGEADPFFARQLARLLSVEALRPLLADGMRWAAFTWLAGGVLAGWLASRAAAVPVVRGARAGLAEVGAALGALLLLFGGFVAVQGRYLFGGVEYLAATAGLTMAEYARRGFFEVAVVAALTVPLLLFADWLLDQASAAVRLRFRLLTGTILVLLALMIGSSVFRLGLYVERFGFTELRVYTVSFLGWLLLVLGWFAATVLRGRRAAFSGGAAALAVAVVLGLNALDPDALIARRNLARVAAGAYDDLAYVARLSADAWPAIAAAAPTLSPPQRCALSAALGARPAAGRWTVARWRAPAVLARC